MKTGPWRALAWAGKPRAPSVGFAATSPAARGRSGEERGGRRWLGVRRDGLSHRSHGGQFALGLEQLKDAPKARREAGGQGPLLDLLKPQGSHLP